MNNVCTTRRKQRPYPMYLPRDEPDREPDREPDDESDCDIESDVSNAADMPMFQRGDAVIVSLSPDQEAPLLGWGGVRMGDVGMIVDTVDNYIENKQCYQVDFPDHKGWIAMETELQKRDT